MALLHKLRRNLADLIDPESDRRLAPPPASATRSFGESAAFVLEEEAASRPASILLPLGADEPLALAPSSPRLADPFAELCFSYRPSWNPAHGVIAAYLCVPMLREQPGRAQRVSAALVLKDDPSALERLDFVTLHNAIGVAQGFVREKRRLLITVPVRFATVSAASNRQRYVDVLDERLSPEAASLLVIELTNVPDADLVEPRLLEICEPLREHARAVIVRLRPDITEFGPFAAAHIAAVGCDLSEQSGPELALMQRMARFSRGAAKAGVATYLRGIGSVSLTAAALGAGFAHVDGDAVALMVDQPNGVVQFSLFDLYNPPCEA
jgi:hypothetical protein